LSPIDQVRPDAVRHRSRLPCRCAYRGSQLFDRLTVRGGPHANHPAERAARVASVSAVSERSRKIGRDPAAATPTRPGRTHSRTPTTRADRRSTRPDVKPAAAPARRRAARSDSPAPARTADFSGRFVALLVSTGRGETGHATTA
jgi:hypothetical protein